MLLKLSLAIFVIIIFVGIMYFVVNWDDIVGTENDPSIY